MSNLELLERRILRERKARKEAEGILEAKALELFKANSELQQLNNNLEKEVNRRSKLLKENETKYRSVIENMELGLLETDNNGLILKAYQKFNELTGYEENELIGKNANTTLVVEQFIPVVENMRGKRLKGESGVDEIKIRKKDGTELWVIKSSTPFFDEKGNLAGHIGIHYDITDRKKMEDKLRVARKMAIEAQQAEKQFLASMSHEIRTPLNAIIGMTHLLNDTALNHEQRGYLDVLSSSASILKNLISDILDISKIDAGSLEVNLKTVNLKAETFKLINIFKAKSSESKVDFSLEFDDNIKNQVFCDVQLLNQVLINLLGNAEKFTQEGSVKLKVTLQAHDSNCYVILFEVKDTGIGMSPLELEKVFEQFTQANAEIRRNYGGTGLGLTISKRLVDLMGGYIDVSSKQGEGSNFYFTLDLKFSDQIADLDIKEIKDIQLNIPTTPMEIMVVEDNEMNIKYISSLLKKWNLKADISWNGQEAIDNFKKKHYDLIFMDLNMPVMDGFEATRVLRKTPHPNRNVPIIALTASTFLSKKELALQAGMTDFLSKPFTPEQLAEILNKYAPEDLSALAEIHTEDNLSFRFNKKLDENHLNLVYENDLEHVEAMFEVFLDIVDEELEILNNNAKIGTKEEVKKQAHKMKPTFSMVGITHLTKKMEYFEDNVLEMDSLKIDNFVRSFSLEMKEYIPILQEELHKIRVFNNNT